MRKKLEYSTQKSLRLLICSYQFASLLYHREYALDLPFLPNITLEALLVLFPYLCQIQLQLCLGLPHFIPTRTDCTSTLVPKYLFLLSLPILLLLAPQFDQQASSTHASVLSSLPHFLCLGIPSCCVLWKESLKICQLSSAPLSLRIVSQRVL